MSTPRRSLDPDFLLSAFCFLICNGSCPDCPNPPKCPYSSRLHLPSLAFFFEHQTRIAISLTVLRTLLSFDIYHHISWCPVHISNGLYENLPVYIFPTYSLPLALIGRACSSVHYSLPPALGPGRPSFGTRADHHQHYTRPLYYCSFSTLELSVNHH